MNYYKRNTAVIDEQVWADYVRTRDISLRNDILEAYLYLVSTNIKRMNIIASCQQDIEDITNHGIVELIKCIERYDYTRGIQFDSYASIRVRGSIIDYIRKRDWVPHDVRKRVKDLNQCEMKFRSEFGREPSDAELSERLHVKEGDIAKIRQDELNINLLAFEELIGDNNPEDMDDELSIDSMKPEDEVLKEEFKKTLAKYIDELDKNEKTVISLYYYEELKLKEIAFVMDLTPARISQIHAKALSKLRTRLAGYLSK